MRPSIAKTAAILVSALLGCGPAASAGIEISPNNRLILNNSAAEQQQIQQQFRREQYQQLQQLNRREERRTIQTQPQRQDVPVMKPSCRVEVFGNKFVTRCR